MSAKLERREVQESGSTLAHHSMSSHNMHDQKERLETMNRIPKKLQKQIEKAKIIQDWEAARHYRIILDVARALQGVDGTDWSVADREIIFLKRYGITTEDIRKLKLVPLDHSYSHGLISMIAGWRSLPSYQDYKPD